VAYVEVVADATEATTASEDGSLEPDPDLELDAPAQAAPREPGAPSPDPSNYAVTADRRIVIQAEETLGHYAEWLEVRASELRRLNRMSYKTPLVIGRTLRLDFSKVTPEVFEERRLEFHQAIQDDFFSSYVVSGTTQHTLRRGESVWYLAERKFRVPVWLLRQYNPDLDFGSLPVGASLVIPEIQPRPS
jgi:membrane-bound lytic murein transglycosylase D